MRVLITGGFGFVGGRLAQHLSRLGLEVVLGSRTAQIAPDWLPQARVTRMVWNDSNVLAENCEGADVVIHAAGMNAQDCAADPLEALGFNGLATARLVAAAVRSSVKRFVYLSTAHVYSNPLSGTITEETCLRNIHPYATSHRAGEDAVLFASQRGAIDGVVLRLSNVFGRPAHRDVDCWMLLVNDLCRNAVETGVITLHSSGSQLRDFISMADACCLVQRFVNIDDATPNERVFNVGSGRAIAVFDMAERIRERCRQRLNFAPSIQRPEYDPCSPKMFLDYQTKYETKPELIIGQNDDSEIDSLLKSCVEWFGLKRGC